MIGASRHGSLWSGLLGTTAGRVVESPPCSVLVVRHSPLNIWAGEVMQREVFTVRSETPIATLVELLIARGVKAVPVVDQNGRTLLDRDEHMRPDTTMQSLGALKPSFAEMGETYGFDQVAIQRYPEIEAIDHVHHAGNSSGIVDGAAAVLLGSAEAGQRSGFRPRARIRAFANIGSEPSIMLTGPADVTRKVLKRAGMTLADIDLVEINEAFAAVVLRYIQELDLDLGKVNVAGGAIAMGHPLGATGAIILGTVLDELERRNLNSALVTLCIGAGMGTATIIERV